MQTQFFSGRLLKADDLQAEQGYGIARRAMAGDAAPQASSLADAVASSLPQGLLERVALNPQPLPPRELGDALASSLPQRLLERVALNPQPLPPRELGDAPAKSLPQGLLERVGLNPQPLPPRELSASSELDMLRLQAVMAALQQAEQLRSNVSQAMHESSSAIINNIK